MCQGKKKECYKNRIYFAKILLLLDNYLQTNDNQMGTTETYVKTNISSFATQRHNSKIVIIYLLAEEE